MSANEQQRGEESPRKTSFDQLDRERIRAALFRYMEEHRVGVPTLIAHMAKAVKREQRYIPQKTLQRFLAGEMRTNDATVGIFYEFARTLPPAGDEIAELSVMLGTFFALPKDAGSLRPVAVPAGLYQSYTGSPPDHLLSSSRLEVGILSILSTSGPARIWERWFGPPLGYFPQTAPPEGRPERGERFEGAMVALNGSEFALLRSMVTRLPRVHFFHKSHGVLRSECLASMVTDPADWPPSFEQLHFEQVGAASRE